jgi:2,4-dienoyl-CoA reductase-like NADH-dependent reductase (Old Yellow Enzyme family)/alpha-beta hydrolase superfamily lysophospholipase
VSALFSPATIGTVRLSNRLVRSATLECLCPEPGTVTDRYVRLYENLALGGVGLIITGNFFIHRLGIVQGNNLLVDSDAVIPELEKVTAAVRRHNVPIFAQLNHGGRYARPALDGAEPLAPSAVRDSINRIVPREMTEAEIDTAIEAFAAAARRVQQAGFDGVELNASHGYLLNQFLSGFTNRRRDAWGGGVETRFRFLGEVVRRTRSAVGPGFPVTVKLNGCDFMPGGITVDECVHFARALESLGVCGLTISGGFKEKAFRTMCKGDIPRQHVLAGRRGIERLMGHVLLAAMQKGAEFREGYFLPQAAAVKRAVSIPVTSVGGFRTLSVMEQALLDGSADLIGLSRPLIREPRLPLRLKEGSATAASCVNCNRCTVMTALLSEGVRCHWKKESEPDQEQGTDGIAAERLQTSDGFGLFFRSAVPERPRGAVFFLHGMSEHSGMYLHVIRALADAGFLVVAPDQRGRGRSVDERWRRGDLHSAERVLQDLHELRARHTSGCNGLPQFLVGISMGSIIAQMYALRHPAGLSGMVLVGPPFGIPQNVSRPLLLGSSLLAAAAPRFSVRPAPSISDISRIRAFQNELDWDPWCYHGPMRARTGRELVRCLRELKARPGAISLPLLILYGTEDRIVSLREVEQLHRRWGSPDRTLRKMEGLYHDVLNEPERDAAIGGLVRWLSDRTPAT